MATVFRVMPRNVIEVDGGTVLCGARGTPISLHRSVNAFSEFWHFSAELSMKRKSSRTFTTLYTWNFSLNIQRRAEENVSNILQEDEHPMGRHLSK